MKRCLALALLGIVSTLAVLGYNFWAYGCGRCRLANFLIIGPFELALMTLVLLLAMFLTVLKLRRRRRGDKSRCRCGAVLAADWAFCPLCGSCRSPRG